jgi:hypothetical protein
VCPVGTIRGYQPHRKANSAVIPMSSLCDGGAYLERVQIAPTCTCVHIPPRAVLTLRSLSLAAMALWLVAPARMISSMIGRTLAANRLRLALRAA